MTRADLIPSARDVDTDLITRLQRELAKERRGRERIAEALGLPLDTDVGRLVDEIWRLR